MSTAQAAAVQAGWGEPDKSNTLQLQRAQGKARTETLRLSINEIDTSLDINIDGSFG